MAVWGAGDRGRRHCSARDSGVGHHRLEAGILVGRLSEDAVARGFDGGSASYRLTESYDVRSAQEGAYVQDGWTGLGDRLTLTLGGRGSRFIKHQCGSYVLQAQDEATTDLSLYEEIKADHRSADDTRNMHAGHPAQPSGPRAKGTTTSHHAAPGRPRATARARRPGSRGTGRCG